MFVPQDVLVLSGGTPEACDRQGSVVTVSLLRHLLHAANCARRIVGLAVNSGYSKR